MLQVIYENGNGWMWEEFYSYNNYLMAASSLIMGGGVEMKRRGRRVLGRRTGLLRGLSCKKPRLARLIAGGYLQNCPTSTPIHRMPIQRSWLEFPKFAQNDWFSHHTLPLFTAAYAIKNWCVYDNLHLELKIYRKEKGHGVFTCFGIPIKVLKCNKIKLTRSKRDRRNKLP